MLVRVEKVLLALVVTCVCAALAFADHSSRAMAIVSPAGGLPQAALSPESCVSDIDELSSRAYQEAFDSSHDVDRTALRHRTKIIASKCVSSYSVASVRQEQLPALSRLYFEAGQPSRAYETVSRYLKLPIISKAAKAELLLRSISFSIAYADDAGKAAEAYIKRFELVGDDFVRQRISGPTVGEILSNRRKRCRRTLKECRTSSARNMKKRWHSARSAIVLDVSCPTC